MKRLYLKIYLTIVVTLLLVVLVAGAIWRFGKPPGPVAEGFEVAGELLSAAIPPAEARRSRRSRTRSGYSRSASASMWRCSIRSCDLIASYGDPPPPRA